ncbi:MAG: ABC transporter permease [Christensenella sp.]|nr:ABC transporter permease [Christensenella sp.]
MIKQIYVYVILAIVVAVLSLLKGDLFQRGNFLFPPNIANLLRMSAPILMISSAFTLIFITGNMDLSVGSILSLTTVVNAILLLNGFSFLTAMVIVLALGVVLGFVNGFLVMKLRITPVIATLITMNAYQGLARYLVPPGISSITNTDTLTMPEWMGHFAKGQVFLGLSWAFIVAIALLIGLVILQRCTVFGKYLVAAGGNRTAAELSGINVVKVVWGVYILLGAVSALAGVARASYLLIGEPYTGTGAETEAIIACLLGGTVFSGGEGSVVKSFVGALIIVCLTFGLKSVIPEYWQMLAKGAVLVFAVVLNHLLSKETAVA